jgi:hypothetical protein
MLAPPQVTTNQAAHRKRKAETITLLSPGRSQVPVRGKIESGCRTQNVRVLHGRAAAVAHLARTARTGSSPRTCPAGVHDNHGTSQDFAARLAELGVQFSVGASLGHFDIHTALALLPAVAWTPAYQFVSPAPLSTACRSGSVTAPGSPRRPSCEPVALAGRHEADPAQGATAPRRSCGSPTLTARTSPAS